MLPGAFYLFLNQRATVVQQMPVLHTRWASGFAAAAGQAAIQMLKCFYAGSLPLYYLLDQIDAPTRAIQFVAKQVIGRASGQAKTAMHAAA